MTLLYITLIFVSFMSFSDNISVKSLHNWNFFKQYYNKKYEGQEDFIRHKIWENNLKIITKHNEEYYLGLQSFLLEINSFADLTNDEFHHLTMHRRFVINPIPITNKLFFDIRKLPDSIDYRDKGVVTPVKNQGQLGYASVFATTGALESHTALLTGNLTSLSEANILNCCPKCMTPEDGFEYVKRNHGIDTEDSFPCSTEGCGFCKEFIGATCSGYQRIASGDEQEMKKVLATIGPTAILVDASQLSFQLYSDGIYDESLCSSTLLDHAMLIVGYGTESGKDYWLVLWKNSWGTDWGQNGYIKMSRNKNNQCGIATEATYPLVP